MIVSDVSNIFYSGQWRKARMWVHQNGQWKDFQEPVSYNTAGQPARRAWVLMDEPTMEGPAWVPLHFEVCSAPAAFTGSWWIDQNTQTNSGRWDYWLSRDPRSRQDDALNTAILWGKGSQEQKTGTIHWQQRIPYLRRPMSGVNSDFDRSRPVQNVVADNYRGAGTIEVDERLQWFIAPNTNLATRFSSFLPNGAVQSQTGWILSPGSFTAATFMQAHITNGNKDVIRDPNVAPLTRHYGYCFMTPVQVLSTSINWMPWSGIRVLTYVIFDDENSVSPTNMWPIGGMPTYFTYTWPDRLGSDGWPLSWIEGLEVVSCPEGGYDVLVCTLQSITGVDANGLSRKSQAFIGILRVNHSDLTARNGPNPASTPIYVKDYTSRNYRISVSPTQTKEAVQIVLNGATIIQYPSQAPSSAGFGCLFVSYTVAESQGPDPWGDDPLADDTDFTYYGWFIDLGPDSMTGIAGFARSMGRPAAHVHPGATNTSRFMYFLQLSLFKGAIGNYGRTPFLSRAWGTHLAPFQKPTGIYDRQYMPGEIRWQWKAEDDIDQSAGETPFGPLLYGRRLTAKIAWAYNEMTLPPGSDSWGTIGQYGISQILRPKRVTVPWSRASQGWNMQCWHLCICPGELQNLHVFSDERNGDPDKPIKAWTFACIGLRRIDNNQPLMGITEHPSTAQTRDMTTYMNVEVPPDGAYGFIHT